jgi:hypothetical protein
MIKSLRRAMSDAGGLAREAWWPAVEMLISVSQHSDSTVDKDLLDRVSVAGFDVRSVGAQWMADVLSN